MGGRALATAAVLAVLGATADGAIARAATLPQLANVGDPPASIQPGGAFTARVRVVNGSRRVSSRAVMTFKLAPPSGRQIALRGQVRVRALRPRARAALKGRLTVPATAAPRAYRLVACVKRARVRAVCRASGRFVNVGSSTPAPQPPAPEPPAPVLPVVSMATPAEGADNPGRRPTFSGAGQPSGTVTVTIRTAAGTTAQSLRTTVTDDGAWSVRPASDLAPGSYTAMAEQTNAAGTGRSADRAFSVAAVMLAAGDIAGCTVDDDEETAKLLDSITSDVIAPLGDLAYENGTAAEFSSCYDPTWGRHKAAERPTSGNREYNTAGAGGYFTYFGNLAG
ncbi:MAG: acid phosphatase type 7, partial [Thermoleophilales bacterium]|nr:acid phosphatase type 7 [Thermoleophilales bacterium]